MSVQMYKKLKRQNGEQFAQTLRNFHGGLLDIPDLDKIVRHAGRDVEPLLPYLIGLKASLDDKAAAPAPEQPGDPFALLDQAGYDAIHADTLEKQNSIACYFAPDELLCTFNDAARHQEYHIVHAVKKNVGDIHRADFTGKEKRQDAYGTSVISIQMLKSGGFIKITNRYNHKVDGADNTFGSNPDSIIYGLSSALKKQFNVDFIASAEELRDDFVFVGNQIFQFHMEINNIYYGKDAWVEKGALHIVNKSAGDALFDGFLFDNKTKTLKKIDPASEDSFADDFNRDYGGNKGLHTQSGNLLLDCDVLIGAKDSRITTLHLPALTAMGNGCLRDAEVLTQVDIPALTVMGDYSLCDAYALRRFDAPALTEMGAHCLNQAITLTQFVAPALTAMGNSCLYDARSLTQFNAPALTKMGRACLCETKSLTRFDAPALTKMDDHCLHRALALTQLNTPALIEMGNDCLSYAPAREQLRGRFTLQSTGTIKYFQPVACP